MKGIILVTIDLLFPADHWYVENKTYGLIWRGTSTQA
jgi:hypothetical protein